ncbi:apolipoprotein D [Aedes aegypti]|uniref:Apolipoprotein D n=1 Tax=Aedes aegypti TaxID=7159 RepID=A0A1S4FMU9_AEDAE|nr:apolipoprotein D [Aedes aegypti]
MRFIYRLELLIAAVLCLAFVIEALIISSGTCPKRPVVRNFNVSRYTGLWYEISRYEQPFQLGGECVTAQYSLNKDGTVRVFNSMLIPPNDVRSSIVGRAVVSYPNKDPVPAKLIVTFNGVPVASNYWVLDTDYDNFSVVWSCFQIGGIIHTQGAWILSREPELSDSIKHRVQEAIDRYLEESHLRKTNHNYELCCSSQPDIQSYPEC